MAEIVSSEISTPTRIQLRRVKGWRLPAGAVVVSRPSLFGNPWSLDDARIHDIPEPERAAWCVAKYRRELDHLGLLGDWASGVSEARWDEMCEAIDALPQEIGPEGIQSIRPLFRHLLRNATALACWCPLDQPCHADVLLELLA